MRRAFIILVLFHLFLLSAAVSVLAQSDPATPTAPPANSAPIANDDSATTPQGTPVTIAVLANDSDPDGQALSIASVTPGASGTVSVNPDQTLLYSPGPDFAGTDSFQYTVTDGVGGTATAHVTVTVEANTPTPVSPTDTPTTTPVPPTTTPAPPTNTPVDTPTSTATATATPSTETLTFGADADARVEEANPTSNFGTSTHIDVDGGADPDTNSYLRFTISGVTGSVQRATLRVFVTSSGTTVDGPAVYATSNNWVESGTGGITWTNQPGSTGAATDDKGALAASSWAEFNVTPLVAADGQVSFMLATTSRDGASFFSRENATTRPQLVVIFDTTNPPGPTATSIPSSTSTPTATSIPSSTSTPTATTTPTATAVATVTGASTTLTIAADADAEVREAAPTTNNGTSSALTVDGDTGATKEAYLRFVVSGVSGTIDQATLRVTVSSSSGAATSNGPAVFTAGNEWTETGLTWSNRPARSTTPTDDKGALASNAVVDFNVTSLVTGNGTITFVLAGPSTDGAVFNSRNSSTGKPQLLLTVAGTDGSATATATPTTTATPASTATATPASTATATTPPTTTPTPNPTSVTTGLTVAPDADTRVDESNPTMNHGADTTLRVDGGTGIHVETYLRFNVPAFSGAVVDAKLRLYVTSGTTNGPAVYSADNNWSEYELTWANRPARGATASDDKGALNSGTWSEFNVTPLVATFGLQSFALVGVSTDGVDFASRDNTTTANRPQLVLTIDPNGPSAPTPTPLPTLVPTPTPLPGDHVIMAAGDMVCGADSTGGKCVQMKTAALLGPAEVVLPLGDVQYECGEPSDFTSFYDPSWGVYKDKTRPTVGNHEYITSTDPTNKCYNNPPNAGGFFSYFGPLAGEAGKGYYSYDVGSWHLIALNSNCSKIGGCSATSPEYKWLVADLAAHPAACTIAYMHHPAFSSGAIGNISFVQPLWTPLYNAGVDIVLAGHDHNYERFAPQTPNEMLDTSYGIREFVVGTGGRNVTSMGTVKPNSEVRNFNTFGVLKLTLSPGSYQWQFLPIAGSTSGFSDSGSGTCHGAPGSASANTSVAQITADAGAVAGGISGNALFPWFVLTGFAGVLVVWSRRRFHWRIRVSSPRTASPD
jgi:hypothetical protein